MVIDEYYIIKRVLKFNIFTNQWETFCTGTLNLSHSAKSIEECENISDDIFFQLETVRDCHYGSYLYPLEDSISGDINKVIEFIELIKANKINVKVIDWRNTKSQEKLDLEEDFYEDD